MVLTDDFRQTVLDALKEGDGTAALVYGDWLEDNDQPYPEFFRRLGQQQLDHPDWLTHIDSASALGLGYWSAGTSANRYIWKTMAAMLAKFRSRYVERGSCWVGVGPELASSMGRSQEIHDGLFMLNQNGYATSGRRLIALNVYGLPPVLYGMNMWVFDPDVIPPNYAVVIDEQNKAFGLITDCVP